MVKASVASAEVATEPVVAEASGASAEGATESEVAKTSVASTDAATEPEFAGGYTMTQLCDKMIDLFMNKKPKTKDWRKLLVHRDDWKKYQDSFYNRCRVRIDTENDASLKQKLVLLARKVKKVYVRYLLSKPDRYGKLVQAEVHM